MLVFFYFIFFCFSPIFCPKKSTETIESKIISVLKTIHEKTGTLLLAQSRVVFSLQTDLKTRCKNFIEEGTVPNNFKDLSALVAILAAEVGTENDELKRARANFDYDIVSHVECIYNDKFPETEELKELCLKNAEIILKKINRTKNDLNLIFNKKNMFSSDCVRLCNSIKIILEDPDLTEFIEINPNTLRYLTEMANKILITPCADGLLVILLAKICLSLWNKIPATNKLPLHLYVSFENSINDLTELWIRGQQQKLTVDLWELVLRRINYFIFYINQFLSQKKITRNNTPLD